MPIRRIAAAALAAVLLSACTKVETATTANASPGGTLAQHNGFTHPHELRFSDGEDIDTLNPHLYTNVSLALLSELTMAYFARYDTENKPVPELLTEIPTQQNGGISKDGKTITWHLRRGVKWSDGVPFDADDVVFSTKAVLNPANNEVGRDGWDLITKIDEPDKYTVIYHLKKPYAAYLPVFFGSAGANPCILPKHLLGTLANINNAPYNQKPVGIGPFRYVRWTRGDSVELEPNPNYWRGQPKLKRVVMKIIPDRNTLLTQLQTGEIDLWVQVPAAYVDRVKNLPGHGFMSNPSLLYSHMDFNLTHPALKELPVREALQLATDRRTLLDKVGHGVGLLQESVLSPVNPAHADIPFVDFNVAAANALLDKAGWVRGADGIRAKNGVRLALNFAAFTGSPDADTRIELIRQTWHQIGATIDVRRYSTPLMFAPYQQGGILYAGKFDVTAFSWVSDPIGELSNLFSCKQIPPNGQNVMHWCNPTAERAMDAFKVTYDPAEQKRLDAIVQQQIAHDVPTVVLSVAKDSYAYNSDLTGFTPGASTPFDQMLTVDI